MTFTVLVYLWRKPALTPAQFKHHYDNVHLPLVASITKDAFPPSHVRHYTALKEDGSGPNVMVGDPTGFDYDVLAEITCDDAQAFQRFAELVRHPDNAQTIAEDEDRFMNRSRMRVIVVGDMVTMTGDQRSAWIKNGSAKGV